MLLFAAVAIGCGVMDNGAIILDTNTAEEQVETAHFFNKSTVEKSKQSMVPFGPFPVQYSLFIDFFKNS
jgi:hypothetical protein